MDLPYLLKQLAQQSKNPALLDALLRLNLAAINESLAQNPNLALAQRAQLLSTAKLNLAKLLTQSASGDAQLKQILADKRVSLHLFLFMYGLPGASDSLCEELIPTLTQPAAYNWVASYNPPKRKYLKQLLTKSYPYQTLRYLAEKDIYTDAEVLHQLTTLALPNRSHLPELLDTRPNFIPTAFALLDGTLPNRLNSSALIDDLAHCRHIFDQELFIRLIELSKETLTRNSRNYFLGYLARNPNLTPQTLEVAMAILQKSSAKSAQLSLSQVHTIYSKKLTITQDWQTLPPGPAQDSIKAFLATTSAEHYPTLKAKPSYTPTPTSPRLIQPMPAQLDLSTLYISNPAQSSLSPAHLSEYQVIRPEAFAALVEPIITPLGAQGWDIFLSLATTWQASVEDLLKATRTSLLH